MKYILPLMLIAYLGSIGPADTGEPLFLLPGATTGFGGVMMGYQSRGITFSSGSGHAPWAAAVYPVPKEQRQLPVGEDQVIPGVGAFGVVLGDGVGKAIDSVGPSRSSWSTYKATGKPDRAVVHLERGRTLFVFLENGKIAGLIAIGPFSCPPNLTDHSSQADIAKAYGLAETFWLADRKRGDQSVFISNAIWGFGVTVLVGLVLKLRHRF